MLRIRPTSIDLSERDLDVHFHQIDLFRTLRCEGYSKKQIQHFYETQQQIKRDQENELEVEDSRSLSTPEATKTDDATPSPQSSPPRVLCTHTAVRYSSLLRFAQNAESPEGASTTDTDLPTLLQLPKLDAMTYRSRSQTSPWVESEADDEVPSERTQLQHLVDELATLEIGRPPTPYIPSKSKISTPLRAEAREFTPLALPSPIGSISSRVSSQLEYQAETLRITPTLLTRWPPTTPPRRSSLANQPTSSSGHLNSPTSSSVSVPGGLSAHPSPVRIRQPTRTDPRTYHGYGGLSRLSIYNDHLSPTQQPQTPADLARRPILTDRDTAYTAPPGSVGRRRVITNETSPTARGRELRARWTREYQRAEIVEREREQSTGRTLWLDEWAADRVGEENS